MKIQLASDLHLEFIEPHFPGERLVEPAAGAELLVLAGDIANGTRGIALFADWPVPVVYVAGNHEGYGEDWQRVAAAADRAARGTAVRVLHDGEARFGDVRVLGCTLWTDYRLATDERTPGERMAGAEAELNDHRLIGMGSGRFAAADALREHEASRAWLEARLRAPHAGKTVVVTHHGPSRRSIHPRFADNGLNCAFVSELDEMAAQADLWLHGHVHDSFDYRIGRCRVVANPRGYARNRRTAGSVRGLSFENPAFEPACVVEV